MAERDDPERPGLLRRARAAITSRVRLLVRLTRPRKGSILAVVVLSVFAATALYWARDTDQYFSNLLLNVGASFVGAIVAYALINPLMTRVESQEEKIHDRFDYGSVIQHINDSKRLVRIFETGLRLLDGQYQSRFLATCRDALAGDVKMEILVLNPDCRAAKQRAAELGSTRDVQLLIRENLRCFRTFHDGLNERQQRRFEVRVYDTAPLAAYYRWDQRALISFYPPDRSSVDTKQYETSVDSSLAQFVEQRFYESWRTSDTHTLQQYFTTPVTIMRDAGKPIVLDTDWVVLEDRMYLAHQKLTQYTLEISRDRAQIHLDHASPFVGAYGLTPCDAGPSPVHDYFNDKYGPEQRIVLEVVSELNSSTQR